VDKDKRCNKIGYARVSTQKQSLEMQIKALEEAGCDPIFRDKASGVLISRPDFDRMMTYLRPGDEIIVYSLSRLGRTTKQLIPLIDTLCERDISIRSLTEGIETGGQMGKTIAYFIAVLAQMERETIQERIINGLAATKKRGRQGGRKAKLTDKQVLEMKRRYLHDDDSSSDLCKIYGISRAAFYRYMNK